MYWDTLGPRWPLYADMGDSDVSAEGAGDNIVDSRCVVKDREAVKGEFGGFGQSRVEQPRFRSGALASDQGSATNSPAVLSVP
jgi:hypothetical protein